MRTNVVLTVDTEPSIAGAFVDLTANKPLIHEPICGEVAGRSEALGFLLSTLSRHGLTATFFVETVHTAYFHPDIMGGYVDQVISAGQDVQLHLHPSWLSFQESRLARADRVTDHCSELDPAQLTELIVKGCDQIERWTGRRPTGMRTGNFAVSQSVYDAMKEAGLKAASNICLAVYPPAEQHLQVNGGSHSFAGIRELPVTCFTDNGPLGRGRLRPMQITSLSSDEQISLLLQAHEEERRTVVIVTHPFEYIKKKDFRYQGLRPNRLVQKRLQQICTFLANNADKFAVVPLLEAARDAAPERLSPLRGDVLRATLRTAANVVNDRLL